MACKCGCMTPWVGCGQNALAELKFPVGGDEFSEVSIEDVTDQDLQSPPYFSVPNNRDYTVQAPLDDPQVHTFLCVHRCFVCTFLCVHRCFVYTFLCVHRFVCVV